MAFNILIKAMISLAVGLVFWLLAFMVFMVYAFMPISKMGNSILFALLSPVLYLFFVNWFMSKVFKETERKQRLVNFGVSFITMLLALLVINIASKILG